MTDRPETPPGGAPPAPPAPPGHGEWLLLGAVLLAVLFGLALVGQDHWRRGLSIVGLALLAAAGLRAVLPTRRVGLLAVRSRTFDVVVLAVLGGGVLALLAVVPTKVT